MIRVVFIGDQASATAYGTRYLASLTPGGKGAGAAALASQLVAAPPPLVESEAALAELPGGVADALRARRGQVVARWRRQLPPMAGESITAELVEVLEQPWADLPAHTVLYDRTTSQGRLAVAFIGSSVDPATGRTAFTPVRPTSPVTALDDAREAPTFLDEASDDSGKQTASTVLGIIGAALGILSQLAILAGPEGLPAMGVLGAMSMVCEKISGGLADDGGASESALAAAIAALMLDNDETQAITASLNEAHAQALWFARQKPEFIDGSLPADEYKEFKEDADKIRSIVKGRATGTGFTSLMETLSSSAYGGDFTEKALPTYIFTVAAYQTYAQSWILLDSAPTQMNSPFIHFAIQTLQAAHDHIKAVLDGIDTKVTDRQSAITAPSQFDAWSMAVFEAPATYTTYEIVQDTNAGNYPTQSASSLGIIGNEAENVVYQAMCTDTACDGYDCSSQLSAAQAWVPTYKASIQTGLRTRYLGDTGYDDGRSFLMQLESILSAYAPLDPGPPSTTGTGAA